MTPDRQLAEAVALLWEIRDDLLERDGYGSRIWRIDTLIALAALPSEAQDSSGPSGDVAPFPSDQGVPSSQPAVQSAHPSSGSAETTNHSGPTSPARPDLERTWIAACRKYEKARDSDTATGDVVADYDYERRQAWYAFKEHDAAPPGKE